MSRRIEKRYEFSGSGMLNSPEHLAELEDRRAKHARVIHGKPQRTFRDVLEEKMHGKKEAPKEDEPAPERGAIDPHMGLSPGQPASLTKTGTGRRSARVIVKG